MSSTHANVSALQAANAAITKLDIEGFLSHCSDDIIWTTVGEAPVKGKEAVRQLMQSTYDEAPRFTVDQLVADGDVVVALGSITSKDDTGAPVLNAYSDFWRFRDGQMVELRAFVIRTDSPSA